ncbi:DUF4136 domain-containing protein [Motilimonas sp. 1_MG-2023]|uniref:DUF4136 domain-containing protein n=1 Tax=Motilimonas sp. 1_MG-2023 TaxID=3062672 RepID=UPI0026E18826|nr:DUF4136 domain-containing protein [Motilimonas sp. 1_MG-2023]MDO6527332.1 DUF4136 domain-containing protein [Motilimonas sp. 1_MG-2023]
MLRKISSYLLLPVLVVLSACSKDEPVTEQAVEKPMQRTTIVSDATPGQTIPASKTYTFVDAVNVVIEDSRLDSTAVQGELRNAIASVMQAKGYGYEPNVAKADLVMGFLFSLESGLPDAELIKIFGLSPGLMSINSDGRYEKATLVLGAMSSDTKQVYWKTMLQGFADFERPRDEATKRADRLVGEMLANIPTAEQ